MRQPSLMGVSVKASTPPLLPLSSLWMLSLVPPTAVARPWKVLSKLAPPLPRIGLLVRPSPAPVPA